VLGRVSEFPDHLAIICGVTGRSYTYAQLADAVRHVAAGLHAQWRPRSPGPERPRLLAGRWRVGVLVLVVLLHLAGAYWLTQWSDASRETAPGTMRVEFVFELPPETVVELPPLPEVSRTPEQAPTQERRRQPQRPATSPVRTAPRGETTARPRQGVPDPQHGHAAPVRWTPRRGASALPGRDRPAGEIRTQRSPRTVPRGARAMARAHSSGESRDRRPTCARGGRAAPGPVSLARARACRHDSSLAHGDDE